MSVHYYKNIFLETANFPAFSSNFFIFFYKAKFHLCQFQKYLLYSSHLSSEVIFLCEKLSPWREFLEVTKEFVKIRHFALFSYQVLFIIWWRYF